MYADGMHQRGHHAGRRRGSRASRFRRRAADGSWEVEAKVARGIEPELLLALREGPTHGYDLLDRLTRGVAGERVDIGNLYRLLRALEAEGLVTSEWQHDLPGRSKRTYELTAEGRALLDAWAEALKRTNTSIADFIGRYERGERT